MGSSLGIDAEHFRVLAAVLMLLIGLVLVSPMLQEKFATATSSITSSGNSLLSHVHVKGAWGQFVLGLLLGIVWAPCVGPTLGAAVTLASQGRDTAMVSLVMTTFGLGAGLPLAALGLLSRQGFLRSRGALGSMAKIGKMLMGGFLILMGTFILLGLDKAIEAYLVKASPDWLINLTTYF
jgi:cytochrome c-type biogenesis protein